VGRGSGAGVLGVNRYQFLPPLTDEERASLTESIGTFGVLQPVITDEDGNILDGHHRAEIAAALGVECPRSVLAGLSEEQKIETAVVLNLARRHLDAEQKQALVAELRTRGLSIRWISERTGIPKSTVHRFSAAVPDGTPEYVGGLDGKRYRAQAPVPTDEQMYRGEAERFRRDMLAAGFEEWQLPPATFEEFADAMAKFEVTVDPADQHWQQAFYDCVIDSVAKAMVRSGRLVARPRYIRWPGWRETFLTKEWAHVDERQRVRAEDRAWLFNSARAAGGFLVWCKRVGVELAGKRQKFPDPMDPYILGKLFFWLGAVPTDVEWADVLTDAQREELEDGRGVPPRHRETRRRASHRRHPRQQRVATS